MNGTALILQLYRSWLPLHWAAVLENVDTEDLKVIIRDRPMAAQKGLAFMLKSPILHRTSSS